MLELLGSLDVIPLWDRLMAWQVAAAEQDTIAAYTSGADGTESVDSDSPKARRRADKQVEASTPSAQDVKTLRIGCLVSAMPYIFYSALRMTRKLLKPTVETYIEASLCESWLAEGVGTDGLSLAADFRIAALRHLRTALRENGEKFQSELERLKQSLEPCLNDLSPLLKLETELAWDYILLSDAEFTERCEQQLLRVLRTAVVEGRLGMLSWFSSATRRLPPECIAGDAAWFLSQHCAAHGVNAPEVAIPANPTASGLSALMPRDLPTVVIGLKRTTSSIEFGPPSADHQVGLAVVDTKPLFLTIRERAPDGSYADPQPLKFHVGETVAVDCGIGELVITDITGRTFTLAEFKPGSLQSREAMIATQALKIAGQAMQQKQFLPARVVRALDSGYIVKLEPPRGLPGATAYLPTSPVKQLMIGDRVDVHITLIDQKRRWVLARTIYPEWFEESSQNRLSKRTPEPSVTDVIIPDEQDERYINLFLSERPAIRVISSKCIPAEFNISQGDVFPATIVKVAPRNIFRHIHRGETLVELGSAHVYIEPSCLLGQVVFGKRNFYHHRPGHLRFPSAARRVDGVWTPGVGTPVEIVVCGEFVQKDKRNREETFIELRLQEMTSKTQWKKRTPVLLPGDCLAATIVSLDQNGVFLHAKRGKQNLWLPCENMHPRPSVYELSRLSKGDTLFVQVLKNCTYINESACLVVRQLKRAGTAPP